MFSQVDLLTGEVEKVNRKDKGKTGEQIELVALTSNSASLAETVLHKGNNLNPLPKKQKLRQDSKRE